MDFFKVLPVELAACIFWFLPPEAVKSLRRTCRSARVVSEDVAHRLEWTPVRLIESSVADLIARRPRWALTTLSVRVPLTGCDLLELHAAFPSLAELTCTLTLAAVTDAQAAIVAARSRALRILTVASAADLSGDDLVRLHGMYPTLTELSIQAPAIGDVTEAQARAIYITSASLALLDVGSLPSTTTVYPLVVCSLNAVVIRFTQPMAYDDVLRALADYHSQLRTIELVSCFGPLEALPSLPGVTSLCLCADDDDADGELHVNWDALALAMPNLAMLDLRHAVNVMTDGCAMPHVTTITLGLAGRTCPTNLTDVHVPSLSCLEVRRLPRYAHRWRLQRRVCSVALAASCAFFAGRRRQLLRGKRAAGPAGDQVVSDADAAARRHGVPVRWHRLPGAGVGRLDGAGDGHRNAPPVSGVRVD
jgi:hypothetical protein